MAFGKEGSASVAFYINHRRRVMGIWIDLDNTLRNKAPEYAARIARLRHRTIPQSLRDFVVVHGTGMQYKNEVIVSVPINEIPIDLENFFPMFLAIFTELRLAIMVVEWPKDRLRDPGSILDPSKRGGWEVPSI